ADHVTLDDEVVGAARRVGALREQRAVEIAVIGSLSAALGRSIALGARLGDERAERTLSLTRSRLPEETVPLALGAGQTLRDLEDALAGVVTGVVLALGVDVGQT